MVKVEHDRELEDELRLMTIKIEFAERIIEALAKTGLGFFLGISGITAWVVLALMAISMLCTKLQGVQ